MSIILYQYFDSVTKTNQNFAWVTYNDSWQVNEMDMKEYIPAMICFSFLMLGLGTGTIAIVFSIAWAYVAVKIVNHYILKKKKPEDQE